MLSAGIDKEGNLYAGWIDLSDRLPYLSIPRDGAAHWSTPMMMGTLQNSDSRASTLKAGNRLTVWARLHEAYPWHAVQRHVHAKVVGSSAGLRDAAIR
jgi:hypothetical protein